MTKESKAKSAFYVLKKDTIFIMQFMLGQKAWVLRAGEVCEYFGHSDTFTFESRDGVVPYFSREIVESLPDFFEPTNRLVKAPKFKPTDKVWYGNVLGEVCGCVSFETETNIWNCIVDFFPNYIGGQQFVQIGEDKLRKVKEGEI